MKPGPRKPPLILDFDGSVLPLMNGELRIPLAEWQEKIRFGCAWPVYSELENFLCCKLPEERGPVFTGSGDYHHVSLLLLHDLAKHAALAPDTLDLVVLDNHPDNMRYPFGLHCGSWVRYASALNCVRHVHVIGIGSPDIGLKHAWENYLTPFLRCKLTYWSIKRQAGWLKAIGRADCARSFDSADALMENFLPVLDGMEQIYLSVDKDVFSKVALETDWDQGFFCFEHFRAVIEASAGKLSGCDICGEISEPYTYKSRFKRLLSRLDGQAGSGPDNLKRLQNSQRNFNISFLNLLRGA